MWFCPEYYHTEIKDYNQELKLLKGELDDKTAKITLARFLYRNLGMTVELLTGVRLYPDQIVLLKGMLQNKYGLCILSRGLGKTFVAAIFCFIQAIFFPKSNILIARPHFQNVAFYF